MLLEGMSPFWERFPDVAARETRAIDLPYAQNGLPAGSYGFLELYCADPKCDCRRVLLQVRSEDKPDTVLATINYGWENVAFYAQSLQDKDEDPRETKGPYLDPLNPQSKYAPSFLRLFEAVVLQDQAYLRRLERHYKMFKKGR